MNSDSTESKSFLITYDNRIKLYGSSEKEGQRKHGLSILTTSIFIIGEMAGSGVLALPKAVVKTGSIGILLLIVLCFNAGYGGVKLGACWEIIEERYPQHRKQTRNPYATIASIAVGKWFSLLVSHAIRITLFGAGTVYLLLASEIIQDLLAAVLPAVSSCSYFVVVCLCLAPAMWLGSPKDFSLVGVGATLTTSIACILFFLQLLSDASERTVEAVHKVHGFEDFFLSFGTLLFAFGGASTFPTIQNDMRDKKQFSTCVIIAFAVIMILYLPITLGGYLVFGEKVGDNIATTLTHSRFVTLGNILMASHLIFAFLIVINPVCQDCEETFQIPKHFSWKRCILRSGILFFIIFVGETVPKFGKLLALVGGSTVTLLTFVCPPYLYMRLCSQSRENEDWEPRTISLHEKIYLWELILVGLIGGSASTYSAFNAIFGPNSLTRPCYLK